MNNKSYTIDGEIYSQKEFETLVDNCLYDDAQAYTSDADELSLLKKIFYENEDIKPADTINEIDEQVKACLENIESEWRERCDDELEESRAYVHMVSVESHYW